MNKFLKGIAPGAVLVFLVSIAAYYTALLPQLEKLHISPLVIGIIYGAILSPFYHRNHIYRGGTGLFAKRALRLGIIFYGFFVTLTQLSTVGFSGILIAISVVSVVFIVGVYIGGKLGLDRDTSMLVSIGSAVCGAAAILALEAMIKSKGEKTIIAVGTVVIFGLGSMFALPYFFNHFGPYGSNIVHMDYTQVGVFLGAMLHEVANVVAAAASLDFPNADIGHETASVAIVVKMIRVILLVPALFLIGWYAQKTTKDIDQEHHAKQAKAKIAIPYFAIMFLVVILINSLLITYVYPALPQLSFITTYGQKLSQIMLLLSMSALGLQISVKGGGLGKALILSFILLIVLLVLCYGLAKLLY